jgi:hypothetical protein
MKKKTLIVIGILLLVALPVFAVITKATLINQTGDKVVVTVGSSEAQKYFADGYTLMGKEDNNLGAFSGPNIYQDIRIHGSLNYKEKSVNITFPAGVSAATTTLRITDSGTTYYLATTTGNVIVLPAVASAKGVVYRFVVSTAFATTNWIIDSAEGDNIEGTLLVAGAVVDCDAEDQINFVHDGENLGDYVELRSDGSKWFIGDSGALTASKLTCTDPS